MSALPLAHAFYTNAFGCGRGGFRHLDLRLSLVPADRERFRRWLGGLRPLGTGDGWAVRSFRFGSALHAVLARVVPAFANDEFGRAGGYLCHALLAQLDEGGPVVRHGPALHATALRLTSPELSDLPDRERFDVLLERADQETKIEAPPLTAADLSSLGRDLPIEFLTAVCDIAASTPAAALLPEPPGGLADALLRAAELLPPRLQLGFRWAVGASSTGEPATSLGSAPRETGGTWGTGRYGRWVVKRLGAGGAEDVLRVAADWGIRDEVGLGNATQ